MRHLYPTRCSLVSLSGGHDTLGLRAAGRVGRPVSWIYKKTQLDLSSMASLSLDESVDADTAGSARPIFCSTPKSRQTGASNSQGNLICPYCDKVYKVKFYFTKHIESHNGVNLSQVNTSQAVHLNASDISLSQLNDSTNQNASFKAPAPVAPKRKATSNPNPPTKDKAKVKPKSVGKFPCRSCNRSYVTIRTRDTHMRTHVIQDAAARFPDEEKVLENVESISISALTSVSNAPCSGERGRLFKQLVGHVISVKSEDWIHFSSSLCKELLNPIMTKKTMLPSALLSTLFSKVDCILSDTNLCEELLENLNIPLLFDDNLQSQFFLEFILNFAREIYSFISKTFRSGRMPSYKPPPALDKEDRQVIYYIGGSIMRGYLRIAYRYSDSKTWKEVVKVLKERVLIEKPTADQQEDASWTLSVDRGGLLYITSKCQDFYVSLTVVVFKSEKRDGSINYEEVITKVSNSEVSLLWDTLISNSLSENNSLNLMNDVICCFSRTCCRGFAKRRLNYLKQKPMVSMPTRHAVAKRKK